MWITIGRVVRPRGRRGEMIVEQLGSTDIAAAQGITVRLETGGGARSAEIEKAWRHRERPIVKLAGVDTIDAAESLRNALILIPGERRAPLEPGEVYLDDLVGCLAAEAATGRELGVVSGWQETGAVPLLLIATPRGSELLVPFAASICEQIDVEHKRITLRLPEGLAELNEP